MLCKGWSWLVTIGKPHPPTAAAVASTLTSDLSSRAYGGQRKFRWQNAGHALFLAFLQAKWRIVLHSIFYTVPAYSQLEWWPDSGFQVTLHKSFGRKRNMQDLGWPNRWMVKGLSWWGVTNPEAVGERIGRNMYRLPPTTKFMSPHRKKLASYLCFVLISRSPQHHFLG